MSGISGPIGQKTIQPAVSSSEDEKSDIPQKEPEKPAANAAPPPSPKPKAQIAEKALGGMLVAGQLKNQMSSVADANKVKQAKEQIQQKFQSRFAELSGNKNEFHALMKEVYGQSYDAGSAEKFRLSALKGDFSWLPKIEFRDNQTLQGANGAFEEARDVVHINEKLLNDPAKAAQVYTEEVGHYLDKKLNKADTPGDEGEMFRRKLSGEKLTAADKAHILADNDHGTININGRSTSVEFDDSNKNAVIDPGPDYLKVNLSPASQKRWDAVMNEMSTFAGNIAKSEQTSPSVTRKEWLHELEAMQAKMGEGINDAGLKDVEAAFNKWQTKVYDASAKADEEYHNILDRSTEEQSRLMENSTVAGTYALNYLGKETSDLKKKVDQVDNDLRVPEDYQPIKTMLEKDQHLWFGELKASRERVKDMKDMLQVVGSLRGAGQDADKLVPGWKDKVSDEMNRLSRLKDDSPSSAYRGEFENVKKELDGARTQALSMKPRSKDVAEKGFDLVSGAVSAITDPVIEAGKQVVDLGQIALHYASLTHYDPKMISDLGKAAEKGASTADLLKGMAKGLIETPERFYKAVEAGDWNAIGKETVNLYLLAKTGKEGAMKAAPMLRLVRARAAGLEGGMGAGAALESLKLAKRENLVIRFRTNEPATIRLREQGYPAKPEFVKMKTIKEADTHLGASKEDIGKVGYFEPKLPENLRKLSPELQQEVSARYDARLKEWNKYKSEVSDYVKKGLIKQDGKLIVDPQTGKAFTGDYDLFDIRKGGTNGPSVEFESLPKRVQDQMKGKPLEVQHGAHLDWKEIPAGLADSFAEIVLAARPFKGAKPLIEFHPDGRIRYTYFSD